MDKASRLMREGTHLRYSHRYKAHFEDWLYQSKLGTVNRIRTERLMNEVRKDAGFQSADMYRKCVLEQWKPNTFFARLNQQTNKSLAKEQKGLDLVRSFRRIWEASNAKLDRKCSQELLVVKDMKHNHIGSWSVYGYGWDQLWFRSSVRFTTQKKYCCTAFRFR